MCCSSRSRCHARLHFRAIQSQERAGGHPPAPLTFPRFKPPHHSAPPAPAAPCPGLLPPPPHTHTHNNGGSVAGQGHDFKGDLSAQRWGQGSQCRHGAALFQGTVASCRMMWHCVTGHGGAESKGSWQPPGEESGKFHPPSTLPPPKFEKGSRGRTRIEP